MKHEYGLLIALMGIAPTIALVQPHKAVALSPPEVSNIAKQITVLIEIKNGQQQDNGSGIIIKRQGNIYTVLTAKHVVSEPNDKYTIVTVDGKRYNSSSIKTFPGVDLAVVQFSSNETYKVAKIGNSDSATEGTTAYVAGFPGATAAITRSIYNITEGRITANASQPLAEGYALVYSNNTLPGMSGGPVLNENGELVGVHGNADREQTKASEINPNIVVKTGFNLGIPINTFVRLSAKSGIDLGVNPVAAQVATAPKADNFYIQAGDKYDKGDYRGALADYNQAIELNPNYAEAYYGRGNARFNLGDKQGAIEDYNQALRLNPNYANAYGNRGNARSDLGDKQGAIEDYNQALRLNPNPNDAKAYMNRGFVRFNLGDKQGAIEDYNQALRLNPNLADAYGNRGLARFNLGDKQGAIEDYNQALRLNPNLAQAYGNRGNARSDLGDKQGAIEDYNQALRLNPNPNDAKAYMNRGFVRFNLGDKQGAIEDYNQALRLNPNLADAYGNRGLARLRLGDNQGAIEDFNQALRLNPNLAQAYGGRGFFRFKQGDRQGGLADLQKVPQTFFYNKEITINIKQC